MGTAGPQPNAVENSCGTVNPAPPRCSGSRRAPKPARLSAPTWSNGFSSLRSRSLAPAPLWVSRSAHLGEPGGIPVTWSTEVMASFYRYTAAIRTALDHPEPKNVRRGTMSGDDDERQASPGARQAGGVARGACGAPADPAGVCPPRGGWGSACDGGVSAWWGGAPA